MNPEDDKLRALAGLVSTAPPPSAALMAKVAASKPVRTRVPMLGFLLVAAGCLVVPLAALMFMPLRSDWAALSRPWMLAVGALWLTGFVAPLALAVLPRKRQVLPDAGRAAWAAVAAAAGLVLMGLFLTVDAPGETLIPRSDQFLSMWWHCISFGLKVTVPALVAGTLILRHVAVMGVARLGMAVGAAGGALAGLTLHAVCPYGGSLHVGLAHGGGVVVGALLGAVWLPLVSRLRASPSKIAAG